MTCIVGLVENGNVWIGGDSAGVSGYCLTKRADEKVFKKDEFIFGFTSSFRMGQLIRYKLNIPKIEEGQGIEDYLYTKFLDAVIQCFRDNQFAKLSNNEVTGGTFLFGFRGGLYQVEGDFQIGKQYANFDAVGCGQDIALGCLYGLSKNDCGPKEKLKIALEAAESYSAGVRGPFHFVSLK
jgi:ATP-dependent protease HslVU (ClpYQ) peptidase subunit